jgi:hypothetical protein
MKRKSKDGTGVQEEWMVAAVLLVGVVAVAVVGAVVVTVGEWEKSGRRWTCARWGGGARFFFRLSKSRRSSLTLSFRALDAREREREIHARSLLCNMKIACMN